jgi:hypothetical protein
MLGLETKRVLIYTSIYRLVVNEIIHIPITSCEITQQTSKTLSSHIYNPTSKRGDEDITNNLKSIRRIDTDIKQRPDAFEANMTLENLQISIDLKTIREYDSKNTTKPEQQSYVRKQSTARTRRHHRK